MNNIELEFDAYVGVFEVLEAIGLFFLVVIVLETAWDLLTRKRMGFAETATNFAIALGNAFLERTVFGLVFVVGLVAAQTFAVTLIPVTWWTWLLALLAADFTYYWMHRFEHEIRILWAYHSVHHSSPEFNLTTALRLAWIEGAIEWLFFVPMILIGFSVAQTILALLFVVTYQTWIHTEKVGKLGWLDKLINTPSVHRVHHASNKHYHDKNYGGVLMVWDRLFGTYCSEQEKVAYGITTPLGTSNPFTVNFYEFWQIAKAVRGAKSLGHAFGYLFKRPGWKPHQSFDSV